MADAFFFLTIILSAGIAAGTPILYSTLGEIFAERSGVLNLGVEGMMLVGALSGIVASLATNNVWVGALAAMAAGGLLSLIHAFISITLRGDQVVSGLALTIFGAGLSAFLGFPYVNVPALKFAPLPIPVLEGIPLLGPVLFDHDLTVYAAFALLPVAWFWITRTRPGLHLRAVGENPAAADALAEEAIDRQMQRSLRSTATSRLLVTFLGIIGGIVSTWGWLTAPDSSLALYGAIICFGIAGFSGVWYLLLMGNKPNLDLMPREDGQSHDV